MNANSHNYRICIVLSLQDLKQCRTIQLRCLIAQQRPLKREQRTTKLNPYLSLFSATLSAGERSRYLYNSVPSIYNSVPCIFSFELHPFWMTIVVSWFCRHQFVENNLILKTGVVDKRKVRNVFMFCLHFVFLSRNHRLIVAPWKFDVPKTSICPRSETSRANMLVLRTSNFPGATIRPTGLRRNHSIVFTVHY